MDRKRKADGMEKGTEKNSRHSDETADSRLAEAEEFERFLAQMAHEREEMAYMETSNPDRCEGSRMAREDKGGRPAKKPRLAKEKGQCNQNVRHTDPNLFRFPPLVSLSFLFFLSRNKPLRKERRRRKDERQN